ncbi:MAG: FtsX-like permease family protein [Gemmatimonadaceae bacterium]
MSSGNPYVPDKTARVLVGPSAPRDQNPVGAGARRAGVSRLILREPMRVTIAGVAIGLVLSVGPARLMVGFLFGISPLDGVTFLLMSLMFVGIAALASYLPARRAAAMSPMLTLR